MAQDVTTRTTKRMANDYPIGFVRWTEQRNFEAVLDMMSAGKLDVLPLITHRINIDEAKDAYDLIGSGRPSLGVLLVYPGIVSDSTSSTVSLQKEKGLGKAVGPTPGAVGFIGAGNYSYERAYSCLQKSWCAFER